ncbi:hypothetical protein BH11PLA2_BH11PLA2_41210 [soil metagenome]
MKALAALGASTKMLDLIAVKDGFTTATDEYRILLARGLSQTRDGGELLLAAVTANAKLADVLKDEGVLKNLKAAKVRDVDERLKALTK